MSRASLFTQFRWEQSPTGGADGTATFFLGSPHEQTLRIDTFKEARALLSAIDIAIREAHHSGRAVLLAEIGRIKP